MPSKTQIPKGWRQVRLGDVAVARMDQLLAEMGYAR